MTKTPIRCVIFDCDGTLVDSERLCCQALVNVFTALGHTLTFQQCRDHFKGGKLAEILADVVDLLKVNILLDELEPLYRDELARLFQAYLTSMPGAHALLDTLDAHNIEYCVASNAPKNKIELALSLTGLLDRFQGRIFSAFDTNSWKPDPDIVIYSAMTMGFSLKECVYIDDSPKGVEAGVNAGVTTFQLFNGSPANQIDFPAVYVISELSELRQHILYPSDFKMLDSEPLNRKSSPH
ncbi:HAD-IA family hydrolase [Vibrio sp. SM6]|uniref:HAD-IA family hydrolase n=1 Tax=Vibrio agarilyticus TaxID=2726741 RepID=A0A7X8YGV6_9VIBR|nr:HAD-IA family hydrolase [Vibrio agarilyticus]NLS13433.1 HAD-IA family hydrolase [Vibrio agarilyticus]